MKRIMCIVLSILSLCFGIALAEEFQTITLPAGLKFGMSVEEAAAVSGLKQSAADEEKTLKLEKQGIKDTDYLVGKATVGGFEGTIYVYFCDNALKQVRYEFKRSYLEGVSSPDDPEDVSKSFRNIEEGLQAKYGDPTEGGTHTYSPRAISYTCENRISDDELWDIDQREWVTDEKTVRTVNQSDGTSVYIDNFVIEWSRVITKQKNGKTSMGGSGARDHILTYTYYDFQITPDENNSLNVDF